MRVVCVVLLVLIQLVCMRPAGAAPAIFWFNDPVGPDQTVLVTGAQLDTVSTVTISRVSDAPAIAPESPQNVEILQPSAQSLKFVVPQAFSSGIYRFTLTSPEGSVSTRLNLPTVYWSQAILGEDVTPGGWIRIFGRNIVRNKQRARLSLVPEGSNTPIPAVLSEGDMWHGRFVLPNDIASAVYRMRLSNGDGGQDEWVDAGIIRVRAASADSRTSIDVRSYGAIGDGRTNSNKAIVEAMDAAAQSGNGTVYFPAGRYLLSETLVIPPGVRIVGEDTDRVNLIWPDFEDPPETLIRGTSNFSLENITIYASNHVHVVTGGYLNGDVPAADASDIAIRRVRIRASAFRGLMDPETTYRRMMQINRRFPLTTGPDTIRLSGNRLEVSDCDVVGTGRSLSLFRASNVTVSGNTLSNGRYGWYSITGARRVIFENNLVTAADLQGTGGGVNTLSNAVSGSENVFIAHNTFKGLYGQDREGTGSDGPGGYYFGPASSIAPNQVALSAPPKGTVSFIWAGAGIMVVNGTGVGQFARIKGFNPASLSLELDRPFQVGLDSSSIVTITQTRENYLFIDNRFEDCGPAVSSFGSGLNHVIAGNTSIRTGGFFAIGLIYSHVQASWQMQFLDNQIVEGNIYRAGPDRQTLSDEAAIGILTYQTAQSENRPSAPTLARAMIVRGNRLQRDAHIEIKGYVPDGIRDVIVENNLIGASRIGVYLDRGVASALQRNNIVEQKIKR